jgi:lipopolysaccharide export system protein LptA
MSTAIFAVGILCSRALIRGSSDDALVGNAVSQIQITAEWSQEWRGDQGTIAIFRGDCRIVQGRTKYSADSMVVWAHESIETPGRVEALTMYLEGDIRVEDANGNQSDQTHWLDLDATRGITLTVRGRGEHSGEDDPLYKRAIQQRSSTTRNRLRQTQLTVPAGQIANSGLRAASLQPTMGTRHIRVLPRSLSSPFSFKSELSTDTNPPEQVTVITGGVEIFITGLPAVNGQDVGMIDLLADNAVIWTNDFSPGDSSQTQDQKYQVYLEGNIVILQRDSLRNMDNKIHASSAFFDARENRALILDAELETYLPKLDATVRLRAERIRQNTERNFHAQNAWLTTSQYGQPGYRVQASDIFLEDRPASSFGRTTSPEINPATGTPVPQDKSWVTALNTQLLVDQFPIFYAPRLSGPVDGLSNAPLQGISFGQDRVFGTQLRTHWDAFSLFGLTRPQNPETKLSLEANYFSLRGFGTGLNGTYKGTDDFGNTYFGAGWGNFIDDHGQDNLGFDRRSLTPATEYRGGFDWEHRLNLETYNATVFGELSDVSDRNYLESFQRQKFETSKDMESKVQFNQRLSDNAVYTILGRTQLNNFENNTQWLPRGDIYFLGEPLFENMLNYSSHSSAGYAVMNSAALPTDPTDAATFTPLPYMTNASGLVAQTRHQIEAPFNLGPIKVAPFVLGEAAFWGDNGAAVNTADMNFSGQPIGRLFGRAGVRASLAFERIFPTIQSEIFNLNGLAHKSVFDVEYGLSGTTQNFQNIAQWNEIDDNAQERFRMRLLTDTFGGVLPPQFDPRFYAIRTGAGATVTAPYGELVTNQQVVRLNWHQRLQTKVGPPDMQRIKDWMTLDLGMSVFPDANRDDFGSTVGLANSRFLWNVGDRTTITASSNYDFFAQGMQLWNVGVTNQRSLRGSVSFNVFQVKGGPLDSEIASVSYSYVLSPKWVTTASASYDFGQSRSAGQSFTITRVGEWLLFHLGGNIDVSKNNVGLVFSVEPKIGRSTLSSTNLSSLLGNAGGSPSKF